MCFFNLKDDSLLGAPFYTRNGWKYNIFLQDFLPPDMKVIKGTVQQDGSSPNLGSFYRSSSKEASRRLFRKIRPSSIKWEPFNARVPSRTVIAHYVLNSQMCSKVHTALTAHLVLHHTRIYNALGKSSVSMAKCEMNLFFYCNLSFFIGKRRYECCMHL